MVITPEQLAKSGTEHGEQAALFCWRSLNVKRLPQLRWLYAVPNGFYSDPGQKAKMKAEGLTDGVPDVCLPVPLYRIDYPGILYAGLYIEMKREKYRNAKDGGCSKEQLECIDYLRKAGYQVEVCYNWKEAVAVIERYLR